MLMNTVGTIGALCANAKSKGHDLKGSSESEWAESEEKSPTELLQEIQFSAFQLSFTALTPHFLG